MKTSTALVLSAACALCLEPAGLCAAEASYEVIRDVVYARRADGDLKADIYRPHGKGPFPGVLAVHGGAWAAGSRSHMDAIARRLAAGGYAVLSIDYRLAPQHKFPAQLEDCRAALQWMRDHAAQYRIDPQRLAGWGYSAGAQLVALLGVSGAGLGAVVAGGAPCDFRQVPPDSTRLAFWLGGTRRKLPKVYQSASPAALVSRSAPPMFFYHGEKDDIVRLSDPTAMVALLKQHGVTATLYVVPKAGHVGAFLDPRAQIEAIKFLDKQLAQKPQPK